MNVKILVFKIKTVGSSPTGCAIFKWARIGTVYETVSA